MSRTIVRSYKHASRIFLDGHQRLSPKYGFLFYVEFDFNPMISNVSNTAAQELGMIVKNVGLPKFTVDTKTHNAYNRKNIVQNKIQYDPITITFHDDQADNVRNFWYDYYSFYYRDSDFADSTYSIIHKYQERPSFEWGYSPRPNGGYNASTSLITPTSYQEYQYIQAIRIYSLYQNYFSEYELVNPTITSFKHGDHANGENGNLLEHQMTVQFETVKYQTGQVTENTVGGFVDLHYDRTPSPLGGTPAVETSTDTITDLAYFNLQVNGGSVVPTPNYGALNAAVSFATTAGVVTNLAAGAVVNAGGFALPSLGSLTAGVTNSAILGQQLQAATVSLAGTAASTFASGVIGGVTSGLGAQGTQVVGLAAAAIANPVGALLQIENMAIRYATGVINGAVNFAAQQTGQWISGQISTGLATLNTELGAALFEQGTTLTGGVSQAFSDFSNLVSLEIRNALDSGALQFDP